MKKIILTICVGVLAVSTVSLPAAELSSDINAKVAQLDIDKAALDDVIRIFGEPAKYSWGEQTFKKNSLPSTYILDYPPGFSVVISDGKISELRFEGQDVGYRFKDRLKLGSSLDEVLEVVGPPAETVHGQPNAWADGVLYKDIDGKAGNCYYKRADHNVRLFFWDYKVVALYVTRSDYTAGGAFAWRGTALKSLPKYDPGSTDPWKVDLRHYDLSNLDLSSSLDDLLYASFDDKTTWPVPDRMPAGFDFKKIMEIGKSPGLGVRTLHKRGITGRGVSIAIIDQPLLTDHKEYAERLKLYEQINVEPATRPQMHGAAVASIAVGKTVGVAPEADLYYIASRPADWGKGDDDSTYNFTYYARAVRRILQINRELPEDRKIRVIAIQVGWNPGQKGYNEITAAVRSAKTAGILVVSSSIEQTHGLKFHGLGRRPLADPNLFESFEPGLFWAGRFYSDSRRPASDRLLVPMDSRTTASHTGTDEYVFYREGGWSWSIPYIAGLYALAAQANPAITPKRFWLRTMTTGRTIELTRDGRNIRFGPIADPVALIDSLQRR